MQAELDPNTWRELSALLDEVFELSSAARESWLADLKARNAERYEQLVRLLAADAAADSRSFLGPLPAVENTIDATQDAVVASPRIPGDRIGAYQVVRELGRGGMGSVWLAVRSDGTLKRSVALKLPHVAFFDRASRERFDRERDILAALAHANIARLYDAGVTADGQPFLALEYVDGVPITAYADERGLGLRRRIELFFQVLDAVQFAHRNLVVHRDLKPSNVLVNKDGAAMLLDFGIAKLLASGGAPAAATDATELGGSPMTPRYASPEQVGDGPVTTSSDVYSLGVMLYELLAGRLPYRVKQGSRDEIRAAITSGDTVPPSRAAHGRPELVRALKGDLDSILLRALERDPASRYPSAESFARDLERYLKGEPVEARPPSRLYKTRKFVRRHRIGVGIAAAVTVAILASTAFAVVQMRTAQRQRDRATHVSDFLISLFKVSDPSEAKGKTVTAREILDKGVAKIDDLASEPLVQADLLITMGEVYKNLGLYSSALPLLQKSLDLRRKQLGSDDYETMESINDLATLLENEGKLEEAETLFREALERRRRVLGPDHKDTLNAENNLALVLQARGNLAEAEALFRESLAGKQRTLKPDDDDRLPPINNLANLLKQEGRIAEAKPYMTQLVEEARRILGEDDPHTLTAISNLGLLVDGEGNPAAAERYLRDALAARRRVLGPDHPQTLLSMYFLGDCLGELGRFEEAESLVGSAVEGLRKTLGPDHPRAMAARNAQAILAEEQGRYEEAERIFRDVLDSRRRKLGPDNTETIESTIGLARVLMLQAKLSEAEPLIRQAVDSSGRALKPDNPTTLEARTRLGELLTKQGRAAEAEPIFADIVANARRSLPPTHYALGSALLEHGRCLTALGRYRDAQTALDESLSILKQAEPADVPTVEASLTALRRHS